MNNSDYLKRELSLLLGRPVIHVERTYHTHKRRMGDWVYGWTFQFKGELGFIGCYETMSEVVSHLRKGGSVRVACAGIDRSRVLCLE